MDRRKFLASMSIALGTALSSNAIAAIDFGIGFNRQYTPQLDKKLLSNIYIISDIILPETDTPSATQASAHLYVDYYLHHFMPKLQKDEFIDGLITLLPKDFALLEHGEQESVTQRLDDALKTKSESAVYKKLKQLIVIGYYTSEVGATQALNFDPVPGPYKEMKLKDVGKVWF